MAKIIDNLQCIIHVGNEGKVSHEASFYYPEECPQVEVIFFMSGLKSTTMRFTYQDILDLHELFMVVEEEIARRNNESPK